jgi:CubicO group peptidase (beta-lactamase class C family)
MKYLFYLFLLSIICCGCHVGRFFYYNVADIRDYKKFPSRELIASPEPFQFHRAEREIAPRFIMRGDRRMTMDEFMDDTKTVAFLIIRNDSLLCERYYDGYSSDRIVPSFSMAKSFTSILIGCAIEDGLIESSDDPVVKYLSEWQNKGLDTLRIEHLLQMTSGLHFDEKYFSPFADVAKFYYGRRLDRYVSNMKPEFAPGEQFQYSSGDTQVLGMILQRVLNGKTITQYFQEKIWSPLGMEYDASWSLDRKDGVEKTFCCVNARARDFAKIGRLYLNGGNWNGHQVVHRDWVKNSLTPIEDEGAVSYYRYQWWFFGQNGAFSAVGLLGQYICVYPDKNLIMVRLGGDKGNVNWPSLFQELSAAY